MQWFSNGTMPLGLASGVAARAAPYRRINVCTAATLRRNPVARRCSLLLRLSQRGYGLFIARMTPTSGGSSDGGPPRSAPCERLASAADRLASAILRSRFSPNLPVSLPNVESALGL